MTTFHMRHHDYSYPYLELEADTLADLLDLASKCAGQILEGTQVYQGDTRIGRVTRERDRPSDMAFRVYVQVDRAKYRIDGSEVRAVTAA